MRSQATIAVFVLLMAVGIVAVDIWFFRHHSLQRLLANVVIVFSFATFYWTYWRRH